MVHDERGLQYAFCRRGGEKKFTDTLDNLSLRAGKALERKAAQKKTCASDRKVNLLVDIQAKIQGGKGKGYERWANVFNLKEAAKTLNFLTENGITDYDGLAARAEEAAAKFDAAAARIKSLEGRVKEAEELLGHIVNYAKTADIHHGHQKAKDKAEYRAAYGEELEQHESARKAKEGQR